MFIDGRTVPSGATLETDVCVVGGGAAGITLAREFSDNPVDVCLLESGGLESDRATQALYEGECVGLPYELETTRSRFFGGSTNCWGGFSRPFEDFHFEHRDCLPNSGWPLKKADLEPYYRRAHNVCGLDPNNYDPDRWQKILNNRKLRVLPLNTGRVKTHIFQTNKAKRCFGKAYNKQIKDSKNIKVYFYSNIVYVETNETASKIDRVKVARLDGGQFWVRAKVFILAAGGIENPRLLLLSNGTQSAGLGNEHDLVGRYFTEHPAIIAGNLQLRDDYAPTEFYNTAYAVVRLPMAAAFTLSRETRTQENLADSVTFIETVLKGEDCAGTESFKTIYQEYRKGSSPQGLCRHVRNVVVDLPNVVKFAYGFYFSPKWLIERYQLVTLIESTPNPDSRVTLSTQKDRLGCNVVRLDWRLTDADRRMFERTAEILADEFEASGVGVVSMPESNRWPPKKWTWHHMGTTRMHPNPRQGVVDVNCRVHSVANLFIAGSSVFPSVGSNAPTLTLIALAVRLADHVKGVLAAHAWS